MEKEKLERITEFVPAYDKRNKDPKKDYGIHSVHCYMILRGEKGATHFNFATGMLLSETMKEYIKDGRAKYELTSYGHHYLNKPMGFDVGYHSPIPKFENQKISQKKCKWIGKTCYYDGSALRAEKYMDILLSKGSDEIWKLLEEDYKEL